MPDDATDPAAAGLDTGERIYDESGREIGVIRAVTDAGVEVDVGGDVRRISLRHAPNENYGEGYLLWRCSECGEVGDIEAMPDRCPSCGTGAENLYAHLED